MDELTFKLKGHFKECCIALFQPPDVHDAHRLSKAMVGLGTDESVLIEIMCTRTNNEISAIKERYKLGRFVLYSLISKYCLTCYQLIPIIHAIFRENIIIPIKQLF